MCWAVGCTEAAARPLLPVSSYHCRVWTVHSRPVCCWQVQRLPETLRPGLLLVVEGMKLVPYLIWAIERLILVFGSQLTHGWLSMIFTGQTRLQLSNSPILTHLVTLKPNAFTFTFDEQINLGPDLQSSYDNLMKKLRLTKFLGKSYESANLQSLRKYLRKSYEKVMKNLRTQNRSRKSLCKRKQWRICGRKDKVINGSLHLSDLMHNEVFQVTCFCKLALYLTFFLRTS